MRILITSKAKKQIIKLPEIIKLAVANKIRGLSSDQQNLQILKMAGYLNIFRIRLGKYRIIYQKNEDLITIIAVQHRKDVYKGF